MKHVRIYSPEKLTENQIITFDAPTSHYLTNVMRLQNGSEIAIFNGGIEHAATIEIQKKQTVAHIGKITNTNDPITNATLAFAPIKQSNMEWMLEKSTELGVKYLQPVITEFTDQPKMRLDRFEKILADAAEQSERLSVPEILPTKTLTQFLSENKLPLYYGDERSAHNQHDNCPCLGSSPHDNHFDINSHTSTGPNTNELFQNSKSLTNQPFVVLIGPAGGFSESEFKMLEQSNAIPMNLGKTILRAETAAIAALSILSIK